MSNDDALLFLVMRLKAERVESERETKCVLNLTVTPCEADVYLRGIALHGNL